MPDNIKSVIHIDAAITPQRISNDFMDDTSFSVQVGGLPCRMQSWLVDRAGRGQRGHG
ncbi:MAG TPA: hypothetical protein G4O05_03950 [Caldilineae bacterium]|nr:hypothetical protein [Caldilineae bacterium]